MEQTSDIVNKITSDGRRKWKGSKILIMRIIRAYFDLVRKHVLEGNEVIFPIGSGVTFPFKLGTLKIEKHEVMKSRHFRNGKPAYNCIVESVKQKKYVPGYFHKQFGFYYWIHWCSDHLEKYGMYFKAGYAFRKKLFTQTYFGNKDYPLVDGS